MKRIEVFNIILYITITEEGYVNIIEERTDQRNAQINFSLINLLFFKFLRHVSAT